MLNEIREFSMKQEQIYFESPAEKVDLRFSRNILALSNKTSCLVVSGELCEYLVTLIGKTPLNSC